MNMRDMSLVTFSFGIHLFASACYFMLVYQFVYKFYNLFDSCYGKNNENIDRYYYDYDNVEIVANHRYDFIVNEVDENEKFSISGDDE